MKKGIIGLMLMACVMSGCQKDIYDPNYNPNLGARVPDNFEWSTTKTLNVNVEVNDEYHGKYYYAVRVYDKAPGEGVLPVAASGKVNKDFPFSQKIVVPATVTKLYIVQAFKKADASEVITKQEIAINGENMACSFGNGSATRSASTQSTSTRGDGKWKTTIVVKTGETYEIDDDDIDETHITVEAGGILQFTEDEDVDLFKCYIKIEDGGKMTAFEGSTLSLKNSELRNYGEVRIHDIVFNNGSTLYNGDAMEGENEGGCFYAHDITLNNGHGGDKRTLGERSYTSCNQLKLNKVKLTFKTSAWLNCDVLSANEGACTLQGEGSTIGNTGYVGLATIGRIIGGLKIENNILVQCANTTIEQSNVVEDATGMIKIVGTTCNDNGFGNDEEIELGAFTYIIEDMYPQEGDYDMNDIVVSMTAIQKGEVLTISGELKAVGASYAMTPYIKVKGEVNGTPLFSDINEQALEAHVILSGTATSSPINTVSGSTNNYPAKSFTLTFDKVAEGFTMDDIDFFIVINDKEIHWNTGVKGAATWGMRIPGINFKWAQEKVKITEAYPKFTQWFENSAYPWYEEPNTDHTY